MDHKKFNEIRKSILNYAHNIMNEKQPEYTNLDSDVLKNFKRTADIMKISPQEVWAVFFYKHVSAIITHASNPDTLAAEPIESRYADAINYLFLGLALHIEKMKNDHEDLKLIYKGIE